MIPLGVVGQGHPLEELIITESSLSGLSLDEWYKSKKGKYPTSGKVRITVADDVHIVASSTATPALISGPNWPSAVSLELINRGKILGRGGNGGKGALRYPTSGGAFAEIPATPGSDGGTGVDFSKIECVITNYGIIAGGGGGGGGGQSWNYNDGTWSGWRNGTMAGGGAPLGNSSTPVGSSAWLLEKQPDWVKPIQDTVDYWVKHYAKPGFDSTVYANPPFAYTFNGVESQNIVRRHAYIGEIFPIAMAITGIRPWTGVNIKDSVIFPTQRKATLLGADRDKYPYPDDMYVQTASVTMIENAAWGYLPGPATIADPGKGGGSVGCCLDINQSFQYNHIPPTESLAKLNNDLLGGTGGTYGKSGKEGVLDHYLLTNYKPFSARVFRKLLPSEIFAGRLQTAPGSLPGLAGYFKYGNTVINNVENGVTLGRVPGASGEVARSTFKFYYKQTDISSNNPRTSLHDIKIGPVNSEGYEFKPEVNIFTTGRRTAWSGAGGVSQNTTPWPNLALYHMGGLDYGYVFKITLPDEYDARLHDVKFVGDPATSLNGNVVTVKVPGDFNIITSGGGGYITYDADSMLTISLVYK